MRLPLAVSAAAVVAIAIAACGGGQQPAFVTPSGGAVATGAIALTQASQTQAAGSANGITGTLTYVGGTGTVTAVSAAAAPAGTTTVTPSERVRIKASATSPYVYYVTISSSSGATLNGLPGVTLTLSTPAIGTLQEAQFSGGTWTNVAGATAVPNAAGTALAFPPGTKPLTIAAGASVFLAFYQGNLPEPTPAGQLANNVLADPGFESGSVGTFGSPITSTGWTSCTFSASAPNAPAPNRAFSTFTPQPVGPGNPPPAATIAASGTAISQGTSTSTPLPTQFTVPVNSGTYAAVLGGVFSNFQYEDFRYNGLCQTVTVPNNPAISMALFANGNDGTRFFNFEVDALNTSGQFLGNIYEDPNPIGSPNPGSPGDTAYRHVTVPASSLTPYVGQTIDLFVGVWIDGGSSSGSTSFGSYYFVDDFNLTGNQ